MVILRLIKGDIEATVRQYDNKVSCIFQIGEERLNESDFPTEDDRELVLSSILKGLLVDGYEVNEIISQ